MHDELLVLLLGEGADPLATVRAAAADAATPEAARLAEPGALVIAAPAHRSIVQADAETLADALAERGLVAVRDAAGEAVVGLAGALAAAATLHDVPVDTEGTIVHRWSPHDGSSLALGGRVLATPTSTEPAVVVAAERGELSRALDVAAADEARDLVRILRYDDAVDLDDTWRIAGDEMLDVPFWTPEFCATIIRAAEAVGAFAPHDDDPVPGHEVSLATISPALFDAVQQHVAAAVMPAVHQVWPFVDYHGLRDAFVIKYAGTAQTELRMHHDVAQLSGSVRLNDGYEGCLLEFPRQGVDNAAMAVGRMLVWPSLVTHPHRATPLERGVKYSLTLWFELPGTAVS